VTVIIRHSVVACSFLRTYCGVNEVEFQISSLSVELFETLGDLMRKNCVSTTG
jgi:hypothetical protein